MLTTAVEYGYVLVVAIIYAFQCLLIGMLLPGRVRGKIFNQDYMNKYFGEIHKDSLHETINKEGYPDMGCGYYSRKLSYEQWYSFNNAQRAHHNFLEFFSPTVLFLLLAGLYFPYVAAGIGGAMIIGRLIYSLGYYLGGPKGRSLGALIVDLSMLASLCLAIISAIFYLIGKQ